MALYRGNVKVSGIGQSFNPENTGTEGQVLTKTNSGYAYCDIPEELPSGGTEGQVLTKTNDGVAWCNGGGGDSGPMVDVLVVGGGGNGGYCFTSSGGGGGGGVKECKKYNLSSTSISVKVGEGGAKPTARNCTKNGGDSCFGDIKTYGGGAGASYDNYGSCGCPGGNGGGASGNACCCSGGPIGGYGKGGFSGGSGGYYNGGGGGGAGGPGENGHIYMYGSNIGKGTRGGQGYSSEIFCPNCLFGSGGAGGGCCIYVDAYSGGGGTGYDGSFYGGGGGGGGKNGGSSYCGGAGYQGVVMLRYPTDGSYGITSSTGGDCCFTCNGYCYVEFTTVGTSTFCITG